MSLRKSFCIQDYTLNVQKSVPPYITASCISFCLALLKASASSPSGVLLFAHERLFYISLPCTLLMQDILNIPSPCKSYTYSLLLLYLCAGAYKTEALFPPDKYKYLSLHYIESFLYGTFSRLLCTLLALVPENNDQECSPP